MKLRFFYTFSLVFLLALVLSSCSQPGQIHYEGKTDNWEASLVMFKNGKVNGEITIKYIGKSTKNLDRFEYSLEGITNTISLSQQGDIHMPLVITDSINNTVAPKDGDKYNLKILWDDKSETFELQKK
ncbi:hypothetical protein [Paenibacillus sp. XY044]|uniref:hypothetical protein n=1 Tax=Paenibacillus sp. XY044 TaxID=2026089 RepID=UPI000B99B202|nr:hypothetical protein [Paenibacillus sp. XY044]OZB96537.1 hypothetical protein CJP46_11705 [Paenibacillus sp. XY044]